MNIGNNIFELRKSKRLTQGQLAEKLGVSEQSVSKWENNICMPDVSLFPIIAKLFSVSIDRIYGFHLDSYDKEVDEIIKAADDSNDTYKEIEIISDGLKKYPNSDKLKVYLSFSLSMVNRISKDDKERRDAVEKAISLCDEVVATSGDIKQIDDALNMLTRIYTETGEFDKAMVAIDRISADRYSSRITGKAFVLSFKKDVAAQTKYVEKALFDCWWTMAHLLEGLTGNLYRISDDLEKAIAFHSVHKRLLEIFDDGSADFFASYKIWECEEAAQIFMKLGDTKKCLAELERFCKLADDVKTVAKSKNFNIAVRNSFFTDIANENILEEYMPDILPEKVFAKYDAFFGDDSRYKALKSGL